MKDLLRKKRNGEILTEQEIRFWISGVKDNTIPDYQTTAMLMAIFFRGMTIAERRALTLAMRDSGEPMDFSDLKSFIIDKHSSGGIGDKTSLMLAPWLAACGLKVPMVSGRGLGFTGGTLDKLEAIPGFRIDLDARRRRQALQDFGFFMCGQTGEIAPADKKLYALRDVTETVEEISLITASILSKKLSEGLNGLILDIKCGSGAFMQNQSEAEELALSLTQTARSAGVDCQAIITRMDFPLGEYTGNLSEVYEAVEFMRPGSNYHEIFRNRISANEQQVGGLILQGGITSVQDNLTWVTATLAMHMLMMAKKIPPTEALQELNHHWASGEVLNRFQKMVAFQQGDFAGYEQRVAAVQPHWDAAFTFNAPLDGYLTHCQGAELGNLLVELGAGRRIAEDKIDHEISLQMLAWENKKVSQGEPICRIYKKNLSEQEKQMISLRMEKIFKFSAIPEPRGNYILKIL